MDTSERPKVMCVPTARATFAVESAREHTRQALGLLDELGARVVGPREPVMTPDDLDAALADFDPEADLVLHVCASFSDASPAVALYRELDRPLLVWAFREPGPVGDRLWLNSLCGANLIGHALAREGVAVRLLYGNPDEPDVRTALERALRGHLPEPPELPGSTGVRAPEAEARRGLESLRGRRIGAAGEPPPGFTPCEYDPELVERTFGVRIEHQSIPELFDRTRRAEQTAVSAERGDAVSAQPSLASLDPQSRQDAAAVTTALRGVRDEAGLAAIAVRCWPEFPTELGVCPCSSLSRLADDGTPTACERDVYGALTMLLLEALGAEGTYLVDTVECEEARGIVRLWHCGSAATALAADPANATQDVHCNRKIGIAGNFPLRTGPVVLARLTEDTGSGGFRLLIASGESLPEPNRFQGNTAAVRLDSDPVEFVHGLVSGGFPHHTVLAWTDVRPQLRTVADVLGIPVVEWQAGVRT